MRQKKYIREGEGARKERGAWFLDRFQDPWPLVSQLQELQPEKQQHFNVDWVENPKGEVAPVVVEALKLGGDVFHLGKTSPFICPLPKLFILKMNNWGSPSCE
jgi:hypothetical protein